MMTLMLDVMIAAAVVLVSVGMVALIVTKWLLARLKANIRVVISNELEEPANYKNELSSRCAPIVDESGPRPPCVMSAPP